MLLFVVNRNRLRRALAGLVSDLQRSGLAGKTTRQGKAHRERTEVGQDFRVRECRDKREVAEGFEKVFCDVREF